MNGARPVRVICLGLSALDQIWQVDTLPSGGGKTRANEHAQAGGGMAATAAVAAARLGAQVAFWGRAGDDAAGHAMRAELAGHGVDVEAFRLFAGARSSVSGVIVDAQGERMIVNFRGAALPDDPHWLPLDEVARVDAVLADPRWPDGAAALFAVARRHGVPTVLDGDVADAAVFDRLLALTDHAVFSEPGLAGYVGSGSRNHTETGTGGETGTHGETGTNSEPCTGTGTDTSDVVAAGLRHARARGCTIAAVTLGAQGVVWDDGSGTLARLPAFPVDVIDTNGAGDVFHGAFAVALGRRLPVRDALRFSAAAAALKCTRRGGRAGAPDLATAMAFLQQFKE